MSGIRPVTKSQHSGKYWRNVNDYSFSSQETFIKLNGRELIQAHKVLPTGFIRTEECYQLVCIIGLQKNRNLLVDKSGKWLGRHIPETLSAYPFLLGHAGSDEVLCVDEGSGLVFSESDSDDCLPFFGQDGSISRELSEKSKLIFEISKAEKATARIVKFLQEASLLKAWDIKLVNDDDDSSGGKPQSQINGIYCVDHERFMALESDKLAELRNMGGLWIVYCQLLSMKNLVGLADVSKMLSLSNAALEIDFGDPSDSGNISFDGL